MNFYIIIIQMHIILSFVWHGHDLWSMVYGLYGLGYGIWDMGYGIWDMGYGIWDMDMDMDMDMDIPNKTQYIMCIFIII